MQPADRFVLERHAAELSAAWADIQMTGNCSVTPQLQRFTIAPTVHLLRRAGWYFGRQQTVGSMAVLAQAAVRLDRHPGVAPSVAVLC